MQKYSYIAIDPNGRRVSGELEASDPDTVVSRLTAQGLRAESVQIVRAPGPPARLEGERFAGLSSADARELGGHIAEIVSAGLPLEAGLAAVADEFPRTRLRATLRGIVRELEAGADLETVLASRRAPGYLPALVRAGRRSGRTGQILDNFITSARVVFEMRQAMWMALVYPLALLLIFVPLGVFLQFWIIPEFRQIFEGFGLNLPIMTSGLLAVSELVAQYGLQVLAVIAGALIVICAVMRLALGAAGTRRLVCSIPLIGPILRWTALARFSPLLSLLIESRVPLDEALVLAGDAAGDAEIREDCRKLAASVRAGNTLESAAREAGRFPASFVRALSWERHRDGLPEMLQSMADMYAGRARALVALLVAILPPLIVL